MYSTRGNHQEPSSSLAAARSDSSKLSSEEIAVLRRSSFINGKKFVPFFPGDASYANLSGNGRWRDSDGILDLSAKQQKRLAGWAPAEDYIPNATVVNQVSPRNVTQTLVSDCSFVSAMILSAGYENKFHTQIITNSLFPQNRERKPVLNPYGKYCVRLHINGCWRLVEVDTRFPFDQNGRLLTSYSKDKAELWVSLLEKAYLKVMGGYDFPGSNSSIDLHALTGWIPERKALQDTGNDDGRFFTMLKTRMGSGHVLATMASGRLSSDLEEKSGLVPTHAYALLDLRQVGNLRFVKLKNPWAERSWKGKYSYQDSTRWTSELQRMLSYDPKAAAADDQGVFWIEWNDLIIYFDVCYLSWNTSLFKFDRKFHGSWPQGPKKDLYSFANNPQYLLTIDSSVDTMVWLLLSRHITEKDDFAENKDFITLIVYKNNGERLYLPTSGTKVLDGIRINSPFYLAKLPVSKSSSHEKYTIIVSEYEKNHDIDFTLTAYANVKFSLKELNDNFSHQKRVKSEWNSSNAGGCQNNRETYSSNPITKITICSKCTLLIEIRAPKQYSVQMQLEDLSEKKLEESGSYRSGYSVLKTVLDPGTYQIRSSTFNKGEIGPFFLDFSSDMQFLL
ncbi:unnamed protein product [Oikopleura dioica]|uniref:Calpain catalytic domain-containing protein n=1 Tax=Oikopleura dioica TaxID=34765 RepID=E4WYV1_OIKDI|nr:unnamed protein product [Oikopleura dioica]